MISPQQQSKLSARIAACREVIAAVKRCASKAVGRDRIELLALIHRLELCGSYANVFIAKDAINMATGELYNATGNLWHCGSKICPNCIAKFSATNRRKLQRAIERVRLRPKEKFHFPTFTIPNPNLSLVATRELVNRAWSLFRKRLLVVSLIRGGVKSEEFTLSPNGYHYHLHCLFIAPYLSYQEVRRNWTECVTVAFNEANVPLKINTKDGMLIVRFQPITNMEHLPFELCKYITKSDSWSKMRNQDLTEVCLVKRWWRMFELFGCMSASEQSKTDQSPQAVVERSIVHTRSLSDGSLPSHCESWRLQLDKISLADYIAELNIQFAQTIGFRKEQIRRRWPECTVIDGNDLIF